MATFISVGASLALVLFLMGAALRLLRRFATGVPGGKQHLPMEVLQRVSVGPRQGIALVRIGEQVVAVSVGDGGVQPLLELPDSEKQRLLATPAEIVERPTARIAASDSFRAVLKAVARSAAVLALVALPLLAAEPAASQDAATANAPTAAAVTEPGPDVARIDTMMTRLAPRIDLQVGDAGDGGLRLSGTVGIVVMMGLLTLLPTLVLMMTSFTRILIVLHFLRQALGTQSAPPAHLIAGLALLLTGFVMAPTFRDVNQNALEPWMNGQMEQAEMLTTAAGPFRGFMLSQTRESDLATFFELSGTPKVQSADQIPLVVLMSAFVTSELKTAFQIGFALFLPFIIIDLVVASVLMSMGMFMLPPAMIALPFKLLLFVLVDGWSLIVQGLIASFH